jgi:hypothetical protein
MARERKAGRDYCERSASRKARERKSKNEEGKS